MKTLSELKGIPFEEFDSKRNSITFTLEDDTEMLKICPGGRFYVKGVEVESSQAIRDAFLDWAETWTGHMANKAKP